MREAVEREIAGLRREAKLRDRAVYVHYEARIGNLEKRVTRDIEGIERQIGDLRAEVNRSIEAHAKQIAAMQRVEASAEAVDESRGRQTARVDTWKLAIMGAVATGFLTVAVFVANLLTK